MSDHWFACRKNEAAQKQYQPYVPKKLHELNLNIGITHDDSSPVGEGYNGCAPFNGFSYSLGTSAHLLSGKTIANNQHIPINSNVTINLFFDCCQFAANLICLHFPNTFVNFFFR